MLSKQLSTLLLTITAATIVSAKPLTNLTVQSNHDGIIFRMFGDIANNPNTQFYIDSDNNQNTGDSDSDTKGADYLIENDYILKYVDGEWDDENPVYIDIDKDSKHSKATVTYTSLGVLDHNRRDIKVMSAVMDDEWDDYTSYPAQMKSFSIGEEISNPKTKNLILKMEIDYDADGTYDAEEIYKYNDNGDKIAIYEYVENSLKKIKDIENEYNKDGKRIGYTIIPVDYPNATTTVNFDEHGNQIRMARTIRYGHISTNSTLIYREDGQIESEEVRYNHSDKKRFITYNYKDNLLISKTVKGAKEEEYLYNQHKRVQTIRKFGDDGVMTSTTNFSYNDDGNVKDKFVDNDADGTVDETEHYVYN